MVRDKEGHYIMTKETTQQEYITLVNNYTPNIGAPENVVQILMDIKQGCPTHRLWTMWTMLNQVTQSSPDGYDCGPTQNGKST